MANDGKQNFLVDAVELAKQRNDNKVQHFLPGWMRRLMRPFPWLYDRYTYWTQVRRLLSYVNSEHNFFKIPSTSKDIYNSRGDYEHRGYEQETTLGRVNGKIKRVSRRWLRDMYCAYLWPQIDALLAGREKIKILEIGCGNCINLVLIKQKYGPRVELTGYDISHRRIEVARDYFGAELDGVELKVCSATDPVPAAERGAFDLVFSMHCLEQIPFAVQQAVEGVCERSSGLAVMIEPVFEFARPEQKLYLIYSDFVRTLLPTVAYLGYRITRAEPLAIESTLKNQSSIIVVDRRPAS
ncbi:MAG TPA: class I SAM-dependent methyltransferase [Dongiaceae bacterium]|nr:class I SAM-dependent methyltransferase [Dongiaceae bacterium]